MNTPFVKQAALYIGLLLLIISAYWYEQPRPATSNPDVRVTQTQTTAPTTHQEGPHLFNRETYRPIETSGEIITPSTPVETIRPQQTGSLPTPNTTTQKQPETASQQALHSYANTISPELVGLYLTIRNDSGTLRTLGTSTPPASVYDGVIKLASMHEAVAQTISAMTPPPEVTADHQKLITEYRTTAKILREKAALALKNTTTGELLKAYNVSVISSIKALVGIATTLKKNGVSIGKQESGYFLLDLIP